MIVNRDARVERIIAECRIGKDNKAIDTHFPIHARVFRSARRCRSHHSPENENAAFSHSYRLFGNTPALLGCGAAALYANPAVDAGQRELAEGIMRAAGTVVWVPKEDDLDPVTALSGSGPAYFFMLIETMIRTGVELGLEPAAAALLAEETALGAARMALESEEDVTALRRRVTSPGGTTEAALEAMTAARVPEGIAAGIRAAAARSAELARQFGSDEE